MADGAEAQLETFRAEVRKWLEENYPASLRKGGGGGNPLMEDGAFSADTKTWIQRLGAKGWTTPTWPAGSRFARSAFAIHARLTT